MPIFKGYLSYAPFPEGFGGDLDETFQQSGQLAIIYISGNFLAGLYYPVGTTPPPTLPTSDQGPIAMNGQWYFWDPVTGQYLPQASNVKISPNYAKNAAYRVQQLGSNFNLTSAGITQTYDMVLSRVTRANLLAIDSDNGPGASADNDYIPTAIRYTVTSPLTSLASSDLFSHEHMIEGSDIAGIRGQPLSLSFSVWVNQPGTYSAYLVSSGRDASYVFSFTVHTANTFARIKVNNIPALPTSLGSWNFSEGQTGLYLGINMGVGAQYQTLTPNQWIAGFFAGTAANTNMVAVVNNQIKITGIKLEASPVATYFTVRSFEADFNDAIRYYWTSFAYQSTSGMPVPLRAPTTGQWMANFLFPRRMCATPTITPYSAATKAKGLITNQTQGFDFAPPGPGTPPVPTINAGRQGLNDTETATLVTTGTIGSLTGITGTTANNNDTITSLSSISGLIVGMPVSGNNIPAGATITRIPTGSSIQISVQCTGGGSSIALTFGTINVTAIAPIGTPPAAPVLSVGMPVTGTGVQAGTTIAAIVSGTAVNLSIPAAPGTAVSLTFNQTQQGDALAALIVADARLG